MELIRRFRAVAGRAFESAMADNLLNVQNALRQSGGGRLLDVGCDDGVNTLRFAAAAGATDVHGVEVVAERAEAARGRGIDVVEADLNLPLPYPDSSFDVIVSNQVIEHLADTDSFVKEHRRLLRPGGLAVTSTENLASWHNVAALVCGWQPFSLTNVSSVRLGLGNPAAVHRGEDATQKTWEHLRVFAYRGLRELFEAHRLQVENMLGAGYYPLPRALGRFEPRHAAFLTIVARAAAEQPRRTPTPEPGSDATLR